MNRLLIADDDIELCEMLSEYLSAEDFQVDVANDGERALEMALNNPYDLVILDVMMPKKNGFEVLRAFRAQSLTPVLMLTARGEDVDSIVGLELGADDYLPKPCNPRVLVARIRAVLRRAESHHDESVEDKTSVIHIGDIELHTASRSVFRNGKPIVLTSTEFSVLEVLMTHAGQVVSKQSLSEKALSRPLERYDRAIDMHVSSLRKKLGSAKDGSTIIQTVRGIGYLYTLEKADENVK